MHAKVNFQLYRGDDELRHVQLLQKSNAGETPFDLSHTARADLQAITQGNVVLTLSSEQNTITFLDRPAGKLLLHFPHALTADQTWRNAKYDLQLIDQTGRIKTVLVGEIELLHDITRVSNE